MFLPLVIVILEKKSFMLLYEVDESEEEDEELIELQVAYNNLYEEYAKIKNANLKL